MALESVIIIGEDNPGNRRSYKVVDCRLIIDRPYDKSTPTGFTRLENLEVIVAPDHGDTFFHKWFTDKSREEVTLKIMLHYKNGYNDEPQKFVIKEAFCQSLSETFDRATGKGDAFRRLLTVGIKGRTVELDNQDLEILRKKNKTDGEKAAKKKAEPAFVAEDQNNDALIRQRAAEMKGNLTEYEKLKLAEHSIAIEQALGVQKGKPMSIEQAQKANPHYVSKTIPNTEKIKVGTFISIERDQDGRLVEKEVGGHVPDKIKNPQWDEKRDRPYTINCATCATAYALRLQGFDVKAKGKTEQNKENCELSRKDNVLKVWKNLDGTDAKPANIGDWMKKNGVYKMTPALYTAFYEESTQEEGTYVVTMTWPGDDGKNTDGHVAVLERWKDEDGNMHLNYIEPQNNTIEAKRDVSKITSAATPWPQGDEGVLRVDNKLYDISNNKLFEK